MFDTDRNPSTGSPTATRSSSTAGKTYKAKWWWDIERWTGSTWEELPPSWSAWGVCDGDKLSWQITTDDVPTLSAFNVYVLSTIWDASSTTTRVMDRAPDRGVWSVEMPSAATTTQTTTTTPAKVRPVFGTAALAPAFRSQADVSTCASLSCAAIAASRSRRDR